MVYGEKSKINVKGLGSFFCTTAYINRTLLKDLIPALRTYRRLQMERAIALEKKIKRLWHLKQDRIQYILRRNSQYWPSKNK